jgi:predicted ester cyclase
MEYIMQTLHIKTDEDATKKILDFINNLSKNGANVEIVDNKIYDFEKEKIDEAFEDIKKGAIYPIDNIEQELLDEN